MYSSMQQRWMMGRHVLIIFISMSINYQMNTNGCSRLSSNIFEGGFVRSIYASSCRVADRADSNLMTVGNLGVCFGPTVRVSTARTLLQLLRPKEETMAAIMDIKFCNVVVEVLIANCDLVSIHSIVYTPIFIRYSSPLHLCLSVAHPNPSIHRIQ